MIKEWIIRIDTDKRDWKYSERERETDRQTDRQADIHVHTDIQTDRQTDKEGQVTEREREREGGGVYQKRRDIKRERDGWGDGIY